MVVPGRWMGDDGGFGVAWRGVAWRGVWRTSTAGYSCVGRQHGGRWENSSSLATDRKGAALTQNDIWSWKTVSEAFAQKSGVDVGNLRLC